MPTPFFEIMVVMLVKISVYRAHPSNLSRVVHNYVVERGWSGANEHYTQ
jgi:hypothetical protein